MLPYVGVPFAYNSFEQLAPGYHGSAFLGVKHNPFDVNKSRKAAVLNYAFKGGEEEGERQQGGDGSQSADGTHDASNVRSP